MVNEQVTILVIDDNTTNLRVIAEYLNIDGFEVMTAKNGNQGFQRAQLGQPDLILLDVMMPGIDGFETCQRLKSNAQTKEIPVIFMTALNDVESKLQGFQVGGVDYIAKPFQAEEVLARVQTHVRMQQMQQQLKALNREIITLNKRLEKMFQRFATKEVADALLGKDGFELGGEYVEATAMFADIRGFTSITESQTPDLTVELLNHYYAHMMGVIGEEGGVVNQIVGDGIMVIFGAPVQQHDHAVRAVRTARRMLAQVKVFNQEQVTRGRVQIEIGIGIASGRGVAGYIGTQNRTNYTWVANATNLAARLDAYTKVVNRPILINERTKQQIGEAFVVEDLGEVEIRGRAELVRVFAVQIEGVSFK